MCSGEKKKETKKKNLPLITRRVLTALVTIKSTDGNCLYFEPIRKIKYGAAPAEVSGRSDGIRSRVDTRIITFSSAG